MKYSKLLLEIGTILNGKVQRDPITKVWTCGSIPFKVNELDELYLRNVISRGPLKSVLIRNTDKVLLSYYSPRFTTPEASKSTVYIR